MPTRRGLLRLIRVDEDYSCFGIKTKYALDEYPYMDKAIEALATIDGIVKVLEGDEPSFSWLIYFDSRVEPGKFIPEALRELWDAFEDMTGDQLSFELYEPAQTEGSE